MSHKDGGRTLCSPTIRCVEPARPTDQALWSASPGGRCYLAASHIIHMKDGFPKGDWNTAASLIDESLAGMFNMRDPKSHGERRKLFP